MSFLYRFSAFNVFMASLFMGAVYQGWVKLIYNIDITHLSSVMCGLFALGLLFSYRRAFQLNNPTTAYKYSLGMTSETREQRMTASLSFISHIGYVLILLGIVGTLSGIIIALKNTESLISTADISQFIIAFLKGVYIKLYVSLTGLALHIWTLTNHYLLENRAEYILADIEDDA